MEFIIATAAAAASLGFIAGLIAHRPLISMTRRLKTAGHVPPDWIQKQRQIRGIVAAVGDSDNFRLVHTPDLFAGPLGFWWRWRLKNGAMRKELTNNTLHIRLAGIDAPESSAFGMPKQPGSEEAKRWLSSRILHQPVLVKLHRRDQYQRLVCTVSRQYFWVFRRNLSLEMVAEGYAIVYRQHGAEYNGLEAQLTAAEKNARLKRLGIWSGNGEFISPSEHKRRHLK